MRLRDGGGCNSKRNGVGARHLLCRSHDLCSRSPPVVTVVYCTYVRRTSRTHPCLTSRCKIINFKTRYSQESTKDVSNVSALQHRV